EGAGPGVPGSALSAPRAPLVDRGPFALPAGPWWGLGVDQEAGDGLDVLVAAAGQVEDDQGAAGDAAVPGGLGEPAGGVGGFEGGEEALGAGEETEAVEGQGGGGAVGGAPCGVLPGGGGGARPRWGRGEGRGGGPGCRGRVRSRPGRRPSSRRARARRPGSRGRP